MIVAFTGHRPNKLGGYSKDLPKVRWVLFNLHDALLHLRPERVISGMALGVDQWGAQIAVKLGIPFTATVPFEGQEMAWPRASQIEYQKLLNKAESVMIVCEGDYRPEKMQRRNEWMVDHCDVLLAVWDGTPGGTGNCVRYAEKKGKRIFRINP